MTEPAGMQGWIELFRSLGQSLLGVLRAEADALAADFRRSGTHLARGLALLAGAAGVLFWTLGIVVLALIALLSLWLPVWAAALVVAAVFALTAGVLVALGLGQLRRLESPIDSIRTRVSDHLDWWQHHLLADPAADRLGGVPPVVRSGGVPPPGGQGAVSPTDTPPPAPAASPEASGAPGRTPPRIHPDDPLEEDDEP
jgi:hypothetical protein